MTQPQPEPTYGWPEWLDFFGHLHPLLLHLPIGLLAAVFLAELVGLRRPFTAPLRRWLYGALGLTAVVAAVSGWLLGGGEGYRTSVVDEHRTFGIAAAAVIAACAVLGVIGRSRLAALGRVTLLLGGAALITVAGHRGGMMTHGARFLSGSAPPWLAPHVGPPEAPERGLTPEPVEPATEDTDDTEDAAPEPTDLLVEAFRERCLECHCEETTKGKLRLDLVEGWLSQVDAGSPLESELLYRVELPADDPDAMPPEGERLAPEAVQALRAWLVAGADPAAIERALR